MCYLPMDTEMEIMLLFFLNKYMFQIIYNAQKLSLTLTGLTTYKLFCKQYETRYSKTCVKRPISQRQKIGFQDKLSLNAGQKYCRMLRNSAILSTFIKQPFLIKIFVLSIFEWPFYTGFTVHVYTIFNTL